MRLEVTKGHRLLSSCVSFVAQVDDITERVIVAQPQPLRPRLGVNSLETQGRGAMVTDISPPCSGSRSGKTLRTRDYDPAQWRMSPGEKPDT